MSDMMENRMTRVETEVGVLSRDVQEIKGKLAQTATKQDLEGLKTFFEERDRVGSDRLWQITKTLVWIFGAVVLVAFGIEKIPKWWLP